MSSILPRVSGYKRVDGDNNGDRPGRIRFGWKRFALVATIVIGLVWLVGPRERREQVLGSISKPLQWTKPSSTKDTDSDDYYGIQTKPPKPPQATPAPETLPFAPHSPEEDPDPSKTVHCISPNKPGQKLVQYALMIDAGSTGSRIHIYKFNNCGPAPSYEYEVFVQTHPGLSAFAGDPAGAARSLDVLLDEALKVVPTELQSCTPVAVKATAGLRLLGVSESTDILEAVHAHLASQYPFAVVEKDGVVIMDGKDEGVYAWITANYLLNTIGTGSAGDAHTYAVLDLGGASTQIVFEPDFDSMGDGRKFEDGDHKYDLYFGGKHHILYQHSYLGYGLMQARKSVHRLVEFMSSFNRAPGSAPLLEIANPCLGRGTRRVVELDALRSGEEARNVTMVGEDVGSFEGCNRIVELVMAKDAICTVKPCSFNGVYQPSILETFPRGKVLLLSYFYDRLAPFLSTEVEHPPLTISSIADLAQDVCMGPSRWEERWGNNGELIADLDGRPEWCLDLTFMHGLLRLGYEFDAERNVRIEKQVDGTELGWCLGATLAIVGGELSCKA